MNNTNDLRIALLLPTVELGAYWQPVLHELTKLIKKTTLYTGRLWPGFDPNTPGASVIEVVGKTQRITAVKEKTDYSGGVMYLSPSIIGHLLRFRPQVIFASAFSAWTLMALLLKPLGRWRVVIAYEGSSPNVDFRDSKVRLFVRRAMARFADSFITNSHAGKAYLVEFLGIKEDNILARPYMVPDSKALLQRLENSEPRDLQLQRPVFLYVGRVEQRKGLHFLLEACAILHSQGYSDYTLLIVGDGPQREELEVFSKNHDLEDCVKWAGWVSYGSLGTYFCNADVFVFPSLEDTWGMVVLEAMAFNKPILCSKWAGASEMVVEGENGHVFNPHEPERLAETMRRMSKPDTIASMSRKSQQLIAQHTPVAAAQFFAEVTSFVLEN